MFNKYSQYLFYQTELKACKHFSIRNASKLKVMRIIWIYEHRRRE